MKKKIALVFVLTLLFVLYVSHPWEWSLMDDTNFVLRLQRFTSQFGLLGGVWRHFRDLSVSDRAWGLFRPGWWVYASTVYLLPSQVAYGLRLLMFYGIILFPLLALRRMILTDQVATDKAANLPWLTGLGAALLLCNRPLYEGLSCLSMQEFSGCFFTALGIWLGFKTPAKNAGLAGGSGLVGGFGLPGGSSLPGGSASPSRSGLPVAPESSDQRGLLLWASLACFVTAAWFKTPFLWFLILYCVGLWCFENRRTAGALGLGVSTFTLVKAVSWARQGGYTRRFTTAHFSTITTALKNFIIPGSYAFLLMTALTLSLVLARPSLKREGALQKYWRGYALGIGGLVYLANLLPWGAFGYYFMGPLFLLSAGFLFTVGPKLNEVSLSAERRALVTSLATFLLCFVFLKSTFKIYFKDEAVRRSRDWALGLPREGVTLGYNGEEASIRFSQLMEIRTDHTWKNTVVFIPAEAPHFDYLDYYVISKEATANKDACRTVLLDFKAGQVCSSR